MRDPHLRETPPNPRPSPLAAAGSSASTGRPEAASPSGGLPAAMWLDGLRRAPRGPVSWLWQGYLAAGSVTLLTSQWKSGKTTLVPVLLERLQQGGELAGQRLAPGKAVVVSEESLEQWDERSRKLDFGGHICWLCRPFRGKPSPKGKAFEDLVCYHFAKLPGVFLPQRDVRNTFASEAIDVAFYNEQDPKGLKAFNPFLLIECKNWSARVGSAEVGTFLSTLRNRGLDFGILIAAQGITGSVADGRQAHHQATLASAWFEHRPLGRKADWRNRRNA